MNDFPYPPPDTQGLRPTEKIIFRLSSNEYCIDTFIIGPLRKDGEIYDNSATTTAEAWRIEKKRLHNYLDFWRPSKLKFWKGNQDIPTKLPEDLWSKLYWICARIEIETDCAQRALWWQHEALPEAVLQTPEERLIYLKEWLDEHNPIKACPAVRLYRAILELYEFSVEEGWIKNLGGFGKTLSQSGLDQRNRDYGKYVDDLMQKLEVQVAISAGNATANNSGCGQRAGNVAERQ